MKSMSGLWLGMAMSMVVVNLVGWGEETLPKPASDKEKTAFQAADTNTDEKITCAEMTEAMCREAFAKTDKNGDHLIAWEEWAVLDKEPGARERFDAMDINKDGKISFFEFLEITRKSANSGPIFSALDQNGDGAISRDEYSGHPHFKIFSVQF